ncbi:MAG: DUF1552 domain-containing protein [Myxococcales bacterium]|nr:DUF1552 domain-containing protein [Myxococcales bacterium]
MHVLRNRNHAIGRRTMLRGLLGGASVAVGLPLLEAMLDTHGTALASGGSLPKRFVSFFFGNGVQLEHFEPTITGPGWALSDQLAPFAALKDYVTVCTGMRNRQTAQAISHHEGMTVFSGYDYTPSNAGGFASDWGGPTIDQVIADIIAARDPTPIHSLQVGITKFDSPVDNGTTAKAISASGAPGALTAKYPSQNPRAVWDTLFTEFTAPPENKAMRLGVLDEVREDVAELDARLGQTDRQRLEAHLDNIAELEAKIAALPPACTIPGDPHHTNSEPNGQEDLVLTNQLMSQLIAHAFACDATRVASNLFCSVASEAVFGQTESTYTHHGHSHFNDQGYHNNIVFIMERLAELMQTLRDTPDVDGTSLLDSTLIYASSELAQGFTHAWQRQPIIIGGHGRGYLRHPGIHYQAVAPGYPGDDSTSAGNTTDILLTLARCFDPEHPSIGAGAPMSTTPLTDIMA